MKSDDPNYLFTLRVPVFRGIAIIHAYENDEKSYIATHTRIDVEVLFRQIDEKRARIIFQRGTLYCGLPGQYSLDGINAKELVLSLVAMKPGDTDPDYFKDYTPEQIVFVEKYGEELDCVRQFRYCDANGNIRERKSR
jgi:hypothetical protein